MLVRVCTAKIHRAYVTEANLGYIGSVTVDDALLEKSGILPYQYVNIRTSRTVFSGKRMLYQANVGEVKSV